MSSSPSGQEGGFGPDYAPLLALDRQVCETFEPYRANMVVRAIGFVGQLGDQAQMRLLASTVAAVGLARRDVRLAAAGARMLLAHEVATFAKNAIKHRIDRRRPRSTVSEEEAKPEPGHRRGKEDTSFPSGHSAGSMAAASALGASYPELRGPALAAGAALGIVQVPTGAHYPSDVVAGMAIGALANAAVGGALTIAIRLASRTN